MFIKNNLQVSPKFPLLFLLLFLLSCSYRNIQYSGPPFYNLNKPYIIKLPADLEEISGIAYYAKDNTLFAESDEKGCFYKIFLNQPLIKKWKFGHRRDFEDIVLLDTTLYVLNNNGDIIAINFLNDSMIAHKYEFPENGNCEFESLYFDDSLKRLILLCKDCNGNKNASVMSYSFDPRELVYGSAYTIDASKIVKWMGPASSPFKPSGASVNPVTGELYILSSINKMLVTADRAGNIKEMYHLNPKIFNHPEGIAFAPTGNLFISNEGLGPIPATILFYQFQKSKK